jgi:hypothetical protein
MSAVEKYYSVNELIELLSVSEKTIRRRIKSGAFGKVVDVGTVTRPCIRVPATGVNAYLERHQVQRRSRPDVFEAMGMKARTAAELRRKLANAHGE